MAATGADHLGGEDWSPKRYLSMRMHPSLRGIPDLVLEGDGYTLEFIDSTLVCVDIRKLNHLKPSSRQECSKSFNSGHSNRSVYRVKVWPGGVWVIKKYLFKEVKFLLDKSKQLKD